MIIYKITNLINNKNYIGQTVTPLSKRMSSHFSLNRKASKSAITNAIRKYGKDNFEVVELASAKTLEDLNYLETYFINFYNSVAPNGYNLTFGGDNHKRSEETKLKLSKVLKGKTKKGHPVSEELKLRFSRERKGMAPMIAIQKRAELSSKPIKRICPITNEVTIYPNAKTAARELNLSSSHIAKGAKYPNRGYTSGGYKWEYVDLKHVIDSESGRVEYHWEAKKKSISLKKNDEILHFESQKEAAAFLNTRPQNISRVMNGKRNSIKGYIKC